MQLVGLIIPSLQREDPCDRSPNPTNAVGGSFILGLQGRPVRLGFPKSHQRSWWIVHTWPTGTAGPARLPQIPPTQLVDRSYLAYRDGRSGSASPNPTNAVGGSFILSLSRQSSAVDPLTLMRMELHTWALA